MFLRFAPVMLYSARDFSVVRGLGFAAHRGRGGPHRGGPIRAHCQIPRPAQHFILPAAAIGAVLCALALFGFGGEAIVGGWMPVSLVGAPLLISIAPPTAALVTALACVGLAQAIRSHGQTDVVVAARALAFAALMLTTLAANMLTLFVGMGLVELLLCWRRRKLRQTKSLGEMCFGTPSSRLARCFCWRWVF